MKNFWVKSPIASQKNVSFGPLGNESMTVNFHIKDKGHSTIAFTVFAQHDPIANVNRYQVWNEDGLHLEVRTEP